MNEHPLLDQLPVHLVWATKNRAPLIAVELDAPLITFFREKAAEHSCELIAAGCYFDHVHVLLRFVARVDLASVVQGLKGASSRAFNVVPGTDSVLYWQNGYRAESFGPALLPGLVQYVKRQRTRHPISSAPEPWEARLFPQEQ